MKLIDTDTLRIGELYNRDEIYYRNTYESGVRRVLKAIADAPTIDAVPVDKIQFTDLYLDGSEAIAVFKFGNQGITLRKKCEDFAPVVHGRWEKDPNMMRMDGCIYDYRCSHCHSLAEKGCYNNHELFTNYCHNCGAKMDGEADV